MQMLLLSPVFRMPGKSWGSETFIYLALHNFRATSQTGSQPLRFPGSSQLVRLVFRIGSFSHVQIHSFPSARSQQDELYANTRSDTLTKKPLQKSRREPTSSRKWRSRSAITITGFHLGVLLMLTMLAVCARF
jgi:hypothetical protein